jgi:AraC family transcriptional regulator
MIDRAWYTAHVNRVVDYIDAHLAEPLDLETLAEVAHFSPWHFHRLFQALTGETAADRVRRRRLETAAARLLASPPESALSIALDVGFGSAEVFTRAFRAHFGVTPTAWRRGGYRAWARKHGVQLRKIHQADRKANQATTIGFSQDGDLWPHGRHRRKANGKPATGKAKGKRGRAMNVEMRTLPETRVAYMRHTGPYGSSTITKMWQRFAEWCDANGLLKPRPTMYGISQDSPKLTAPDKCRYDACVPVGADFQPKDEIGVETIAGGRYACARFTGTAAEIHAAWMRFIGQWIPDSGYQCDNRPALELYEPDFTIDPKTGAFSCLLCMPVRPQ